MQYCKRKLLTTYATVVLILTWFAQLTVAQTAKSPDKATGVAPLERYTCYQSAPGGVGSTPWLHTYTYMAYFKLSPGGKYEYGRGAERDHKVLGRGSFKLDSSNVIFPSGPLKGVPGKYELKKNGRHYIELSFPGKKKGSKIKWYCNCDQHDPKEKKPQ